jgi:hypothetical protein
MMSLQLVIPWRVALKPRPLPLYQPAVFCNIAAARTIEQMIGFADDSF